MHDLNPVEFGNLLRKIRNDKGWTMKGLEDNLISQSTMSNIENGDPSVSEEKLIYYLKKLEIDPTELPSIIAVEKENHHTLHLKLLSIESHIDLVGAETGIQLLQELTIHQLHTYRPMLYYLQGKCFFQMEELDKARKKFIDAIRLIHQEPALEKSNIKAASLNELSRTVFFQNQPKQALRYAQEGIDSFIPNGERTYCKGILLANQAIYLENVGEYEEALAQIERLTRYSTVIESLNSELSLYEVRSRILKKNKLYSQAIEHTEKGIELARINRIYDRAFSLWTIMGNIYVDLRKQDEAKTCYLTALGLKEHIQKKSGFLPLYKELGLLYLEKDEWELAKTYLQQALKLGRESTDVFQYARTYIGMGDLYRKQKNYHHAIQSYKQAVELAQKNHFQELEEEVWVKKGECWKRLGDQKQYAVCADQVHQIRMHLMEGMN